MTRYYLFGRSVCQALEDEGLEAALEIAEDDGGYAIFKYDENTNPNDLLDAFAGWEAWYELTEEQYNEFKTL